MRRSTRKDLVRARESSQDGQLWHIPDQVRAKGQTYEHTDSQWLPDPQGSKLHEAGALMGTPLTELLRRLMQARTRVFGTGSDAR